MVMLRLTKSFVTDKKNKNVFALTAIMMFMVHMYMYTNTIVNHDSVNYYLTGEDMEYYFGCGRWLLYLVTRLSGIPTLTPVIGLISIVAVSAANTLLVELFHIKSKGLIFCSSLVITTFPAVANSFCYMYNADGIFIAYFLSILCVWLLDQKHNERTNMVLSFILLVIICGIYQLYWSMSVALAYFLILFHYIHNEERPGLCKLIIKYISVYGGALLVYLLINKAILSITNIDMAGYAGLDSMLSYSGLQQIIDVVYLANIQVVEFFVGDGFFINNVIIRAIHIVCLVFGVIYILYRVSKKKKLDIILIFGMILFAPSILNSVSIGGKGYLHAVMMMPLVVPYFFFIGCFDMLLRGDLNKKYIKVLSNICMVSILLFGYINLLTTNKIYARQELNYEATYGYLSRMLMRIEETEAYTENPEIQVCFINAGPSEKHHIDILEENPSIKQGIFDECENMAGTNDRTFIKNTKDIYDFYDIFLGVGLTKVSDEAYNSIAESNELMDMPIYPAKGAIQVIDGVLTVKLKNAEDK